MAIQKRISVPETPKFFFAPDHISNELYIICTNPFAVIWVRQTTPAQLYIVRGEQDEQTLREAGEFYKDYVKSLDQN